MKLRAQAASYWWTCIPKKDTWVRRWLFNKKTQAWSLRKNTVLWKLFVLTRPEALLSPSPISPCHQLQHPCLWSPVIDTRLRSALGTAALTAPALSHAAHGGTASCASAPRAPQTPPKAGTPQAKLVEMAQNGEFSMVFRNWCRGFSLWWLPPCNSVDFWSYCYWINWNFCYC